MNDTTRTPAIETMLDTTHGSEGLALTFSNRGTLRINLRDLSDTIILHATLHGLKQKLVDAAALSRNPDTGRSATIDDKYAAVREVYDRLLSGNWNKGRGDGSSSGNGGLLFRALCIMYPNKTPEALRAFLDGKTKSECAALRATPKIAAIIDTLRAPSGDVDTDDLLAELGE